MNETSDILEQLNCSQCNNILSYPPILIFKNGLSVCGRCTIPEEENLDAIRNKPFEILASRTIFPCRFHTHGCKVKLLMKDVANHENNCSYKLYNCPTEAIDGVCLWVGKIEDIKKHYKEKHSDLIVQGMYRTKPNIKKNDEKNLLVELFGFILFIQVKSNKATGKFWHGLRFMGNQRLSNLFEISIVMKSKKGIVAYKKVAQPLTTFSIQKKGSIATIVSTLTDELGPYEDIDFKLDVRMKETECSECKTKIKGASVFHNEEQGILSCKECHEKSKWENITLFDVMDSIETDLGIQTEEVFKKTSPKLTKEIRKCHQNEEMCMRSAEGCKFKHSNKDILLKHEQWLCKYYDCCDRCGANIRNVREIDHMTLHHDIKLKASCSATEASVAYRLTPQDKWLYYAISAHRVTFHLELMFTSSAVTMELASDTEECAHSQFICEYSITVAEQVISGVLIPSHSYESGFDWSSEISLLGYLIPDECELQLTIIKQC